MSSGHYDQGGVKTPGADHGHSDHDHDAHGHGIHGHSDHAHAAHGHGAHGHAAHGHGAHGHDAHGHGAHGHDAHGHGAPKRPNRIGLGGILGIIILLGIPSLFSKFGGDSDDHSGQSSQSGQDSPRKGLLASYTIGNARFLDGVEVTALQHSVIEASSSRSVVYLLLASGERLMAMDMSVLSTLGVSNAAVSLSKDAYRKAVTLQPGYFKLKVTGEPPPELILAGIAPLVIGISPS